MDKTFIDQVYTITEERADNYGSPLVNFLRIAIGWSMYLKKVITPTDVVYMMIVMKVQRQTHSDNEDNILDILGYAKCLDTMNQEMQKLGYDGYQSFAVMSLSDMQALLERIQDETR